MKRWKGFLLLPLFGMLATPALACTAFLVAIDDVVLMGNNEDFWDHDVRIWFVPAEAGKHGRVYLGYANLYPQGGMNDAGLAFDGFATARYPMHEQEGKEVFQGRLVDEAMARCATVEEVIELFGRYDLRFLERAMLMFADKSGDSVIVEGDEMVRKKGAFQAVTNFYPSRQEDDRGICRRYDKAVAILEKAKTADLALCRRVLAATAQETGAPTQYSNVFDLKKGLVYLYHFHDFEEVVVFDLAEELKKGERVLEIARLFPATYAYETYVRNREREIAEQIARRRGKPVDPKLLDEYAGRYAIEIPGAPRIVLTVRREGGSLFASAQGESIRSERPEVELIPESETVFFHIDSKGTTELRFERDEHGAVVAAVLKPVLGPTYRAKRLE